MGRKSLLVWGLFASIDPMPRSRFVSVGALTIAVSAVAGGLFGRGVAQSQDRLTENYRTFTTALSVIESRYVDKVESDRLVYGAISGMLQTLDPHSSFMDPRQYAQLRERQEGRYYGLGISIQVIDGDITVQGIFEGSPAYKLGIRRGDIIAKIDGEDAKGWTSDQAVRKLRGPKGTNVEVSIKRPGRGRTDSDLGPARRDHDSLDPRLFHGRSADRLHPPAGLRRKHRSRSGARARRSGEQGHEAPAARSARQPGRTSRSGDPRLEPLPAQGRFDRLHARARAEFRPGFPRHRGERIHRPFR